MPKRVFLTVDTECHDIEKVNQYFYGKTGKEECGVRKILELAKELDIVVNFFVDVVEIRKYGQDHIRNVVDLIKSYNQPVYFHLHPDYVSGDGRSFLWEYSYEEQKEIIEKGLEDYKRFVDLEKGDKLIFRAGRYGVNEDTYKVLSELGYEVIDLSYIYDGRKMCKLSSETLGSINKPTRFCGVTVIPNTRFVAFDYFGKRKSVGLDTADATYSEFVNVISETSLDNIVLTMHSWNFIKKWFFSGKYVSKDKAMVRKFRKSVAFAKKCGYTFDDVSNFEFGEDSCDELINLCCGITGKIKGLVNNFLRFQKIGRLNPKYFFMYLLFYIAITVFILFLLGVLI